MNIKQGGNMSDFQEEIEVHPTSTLLLKLCRHPLLGESIKITQLFRDRKQPPKGESVIIPLAQNGRTTLETLHDFTRSDDQFKSIEVNQTSFLITKRVPHSLFEMAIEVKQLIKSAKQIKESGTIFLPLSKAWVIEEISMIFDSLLDSKVSLNQWLKSSLEPPPITPQEQNFKKKLRTATSPLIFTKESLQTPIPNSPFVVEDVVYALHTCSPFEHHLAIPPHFFITILYHSLIRGICTHLEESEETLEEELPDLEPHHVYAITAADFAKRLIWLNIDCDFGSASHILKTLVSSRVKKITAEDLRKFRKPGEPPTPFLYYFPYPKGPPVASGERIPKEKKSKKDVR